MATIKQSTVYAREFPLFKSVTLAFTGATVSISLSKAGGTLGAAQGSITEIGQGLYNISLTTNDSGVAGDLGYVINGFSSSFSATPSFIVDQVSPTVLSDINTDGNGNVYITSNVKKNQALNGFTFVMTVASVPTAGLTVTAQRSLGGAGFAPCANSVSGILNGVYTINLASSDLNANVVMLRFTATGADDQDILIITQP